MDYNQLYSKSADLNMDFSNAKNLVTAGTMGLAGLLKDKGPDIKAYLAKLRGEEESPMDQLGAYASDVVDRPGDHPYGLYGAGGIAGGLAGAGIGGIVQYLRDEDVGPGMLTGGLLGAGAGLGGAALYSNSKKSNAGMGDAGGTHLGAHPELMGGAGGALGGAGIGALIQYLRDEDILPGLLAGGAIGGGLGAGAGMLDRADHTQDIQEGMGASVGPENIDRAATSAPIEAPADGLSAMRQAGMSRPGLSAQAR